jgi:hypothetical protein
MDDKYRWQYFLRHRIKAYVKNVTEEYAIMIKNKRKKHAGENINPKFKTSELLKMIKRIKKLWQ